VLEQPVLGPIALAWCWDASGLFVAPELPADWLRVRVTDANEPCPACGQTTGDEVTAPDDSRGMRSGRAMDRGPMKPPSDDHYAGMEPTPFVVCCACGHEESIGVMRFASTSDQDLAENQRRFREARREMRARQRESLATVDFPIFADQGWPAVMSGSGGCDGIVDRVTVQHGTPADQPGPTLQIKTAQNDCHHASEYAHARAEFERWLHSKGSDLPTDRSDAGLTIAWRQLDRQRRRLAATATRSDVLLRVDGDLEPFCCIRSDDDWVAVRHRTSQTLTIAAKQVDPASLDLRALRDPTSDLEADDLA
jgi:hypothetical protein